jgi:hypothetical protein
MSESGFTPEGLARTIAGKEVGAKRLDPVIGRLQKLTNEYADKKSFQKDSQLREENPPITSDRKKDPYRVNMKKQ